MPKYYLCLCNELEYHVPGIYMLGTLQGDGTHSGISYTRHICRVQDIQNPTQQSLVRNIYIYIYIYIWNKVGNRFLVAILTRNLLRTKLGAFLLH